MDAVDSVLLQAIDLRVLGDRLRAARLARGWTQTDLAGDLVSVGYVSRLESGQRRPNTAVLEGLASRLDIAIDELLRGPTAREQDEVKLSLDYAELALETGDVIEAEMRARDARDRAETIAHHALQQRAHYLVGRVLERQGSLDDAILEFEPLVESAAGSPIGLQAAIALSRCYRESGDFGLAIEAGERVLNALVGTPLESADEAVQLAVTIAAAYYDRGDTGQAVRICRKAIDRADQSGSSQARAAAYWNASIMEKEQGRVQYAVPLAERALALLSEGQDGRNLARLRIALADMQLELDPPEVAAAESNLIRADEELRLSSGGAIDLARNLLSRSRARLLGGDPSTAGQLALQVFTEMVDTSPDLAADCRAVEGQAKAAMGDLAGATEAYRSAVMLLSGIGADRSAAQLWFELAGLLEDVGDFETARTAYRSAAASTGLRSRPTVTAPGKAAIDLAAIDSAIDRAAIDRAAIDRAAID